MDKHCKVPGKLICNNEGTIDMAGNSSHQASGINAGVEYLTEEQVALRLNLSVKWLQKMRQVGDGIIYAKFGKSVRYPISAVLAYEAAALRQNTSQHESFMPQTPVTKHIEAQ